MWSVALPRAGRCYMTNNVTQNGSHPWFVCAATVENARNKLVSRKLISRKVNAWIEVWILSRLSFSPGPFHFSISCLLLSSLVFSCLLFSFHQIPKYFLLEYKVAFFSFPPGHVHCSDSNVMCHFWRKQNLCHRNSHVRKNCKKSCGTCKL